VAARSADEVREKKQAAPRFSFWVRSQGQAVAAEPLFLERLNDAVVFAGMDVSVILARNCSR